MYNWIDNFLRTGFEIFSTGKGESYVAEKAEVTNGWLFPVGDEAHELGGLATIKLQLKICR